MPSRMPKFTETHLIVNMCAYRQVTEPAAADQQQVPQPASQLIESQAGLPYIVCLAVSCYLACISFSYVLNVNLSCVNCCRLMQVSASFVAGAMAVAATDAAADQPLTNSVVSVHATTVLCT